MADEDEVDVEGDFDMKFGCVQNLRLTDFNHVMMSHDFMT